MWLKQDKILSKIEQYFLFEKERLFFPPLNKLKSTIFFLKYDTYLSKTCECYFNCIQIFLFLFYSSFVRWLYFWIYKPMVFASLHLVSAVLILLLFTEIDLEVSLNACSKIHQFSPSLCSTMHKCIRSSRALTAVPCHFTKIRVEPL